RASCVRVVSKRIADSVDMVCRRKSYVLPVFVDVAKFKAGNRGVIRSRYTQFDSIVLMASRFTKEKNISMAIEAFSRVDWKGKKVGLLIVGDGPERGRLNDLVSQKG